MLNELERCEDCGEDGTFCEIFMMEDYWICAECYSRREWDDVEDYYMDFPWDGLG